MVLLLPPSSRIELYAKDNSSMAFKRQEEPFLPSPQHHRTTITAHILVEREEKSEKPSFKVDVQFL
jgi:hypothetical protein